MSTYHEKADHFEQAVGCSPYDLFDDPDNTTEIRNGFPISTDRFVTVMKQGRSTKDWTSKEEL